MVLLLWNITRHFLDVISLKFILFHAAHVDPCRTWLRDRLLSMFKRLPEDCDALRIRKSTATGSFFCFLSRSLLGVVPTSFRKTWPQTECNRSTLHGTWTKLQVTQLLLKRNLRHFQGVVIQVLFHKLQQLQQLLDQEHHIVLLDSGLGGRVWEANPKTPVTPETPIKNRKPNH